MVSKYSRQKVVGRLARSKFPFQTSPVVCIILKARLTLILLDFVFHLNRN